jgi:hypothetical protein
VAPGVSNGLEITVKRLERAANVSLRTARRETASCEASSAGEENEFATVSST